MGTLIDCHVHLDGFDDAAIDGMIARAREAGCRAMLAVGSDASSSEHALRTAARHHGFVVPAVGIHPARVPASPGDRLAEIAAIGELAKDAAAIGEVGLDYAGAANGALPAQRETLAAMARFASERGLPLNLHQRDALDDVIRILRLEAPGVRAALHYFTGTLDEAAHAVAQGFFLSFGRPIARTEGGALRTAAAAVDRAHVLSETDTYAAPGRTTEPRDVSDVVATLARVWRVSEEETERQIERNFRAYLGR